MDNQQAEPTRDLGLQPCRVDARGEVWMAGIVVNGEQRPLEGVPLHTNALDFSAGLRADGRQGGLRRG